jgi:DNA-binding response OmpR family regulator
MSTVSAATANSMAVRSRVAVLKILLVEDNPGDVRLVKEMLAEGSRQLVFKIEQVGTLAAGIEKTREEKFDSILLDLGLPDSKGLETFYSLHTATPNLPIIVLTVLHDEDAAIEAVRGGAQDYLIKGKLEGELLTRGILYSIERKRSEGVLRNRTFEAESAQVRVETYFDYLAHDIANLLSPIMAYAELISDDSTATSNSRIRATRIVEQTRRASSFILSLRSLEDAERTLPDRFDIVDLIDLFPLAERRVREEHPEKQISVSYEMPADVALRVVGGVHIQSLLGGILENAANYADNEKLTVSIRVVPVEEADDKLFWQVEIADDGPGMPDELKVFFAPSGASSERLRKGISRGVASSLLIYSELVRRFGGRGWVEDRVPGDYTKGAKVVVKLPRGV